MVAGAKFLHHTNAKNACHEILNWQAMLNLGSTELALAKLGSSPTIFAGKTR
ncbi:hypothetical protein [Parendozoicomonas sp. Alg238-R29]|uniref:hypothetical protein n=1 Tax=Parendozoicomonas sp. Alg238-R29 TaxID=2993446 RepID=UPI00248DB273|nr:hypothetical protein [Parendozoicomonas sp. Alg238-R29]